MYKSCCLETLLPLYNSSGQKNDKCSVNLITKRGFVKKKRWLSTPTSAFADECFPNYSKIEQPKGKGEYEEEVGCDFVA
jgi:hypothetical protein